MEWARDWLSRLATDDDAQWFHWDIRNQPAGTGHVFILGENQKLLDTDRLLAFPASRQHAD